MGFFSWKTSDTNRSISNAFSDRVTFPVYLLQPNGEPILEEYYEGYGVFGGQDAYALVARWNSPNECNGDDNHDRIIGIEIACHDIDNENLKYPIKIVEHIVPYEDAKPSDSCEYQGYFYDNDDEDNDYMEESYSTQKPNNDPQYDRLKELLENSLSWIYLHCESDKEYNSVLKKIELTDDEIKFLQCEAIEQE